MPSKTYHKLDPTKQEQFYEVALNQFSSNGYQLASITKIVRTLGIAKGSVYQYFEDKYDLYEYLIFSSFDKLNAVRQLIDKNYSDDLHHWFVSRCLAEIKFLREFPASYEIIVKSLNDRSADLAKIRSSLNSIEDKAIYELLLASNLSDVEIRVFMVRSIKDRYLEKVEPKQDFKQIVEELESIASILFVTKWS